MNARVHLYTQEERALAELTRVVESQASTPQRHLLPFAALGSNVQAMAATAEDTTRRPAQSTKLTQARAGLAYLVNPATHPAPGSLFTRSSLKTFRYVLKFVFWRLVRYAVSYTPSAADLPTLLAG